MARRGSHADCASGPARTGDSRRNIGEIDLRVATGIAIGGIPAVFIAAFIVKSMSVELLRWLVFFIVLYAAAVMFRAALSGRREAMAPAAPIPAGG